MKPAPAAEPAASAQNPVTANTSAPTACAHTPGTKVRELANAYIDFILRPDIQKPLSEAVWYSPSNKKVKLPKRSSKGAYNDDATIAPRRFVRERY